MVTFFLKFKNLYTFVWDLFRTELIGYHGETNQILFNSVEVHPSTTE